MSKEKIEMSVELNGQEVVAYPYVNSDHVLLDNNMTIDKMLESDVVEPVITHEEVSFKVGQGDSDLSDSIVDSSAGGFTIKGQTYQNILPEPSLRNSMANGKTMQKLNEGYESVNTVDGVCKSAILKGNTLVNVDSYYRASDFWYSNIANLSDDGYITINATGGWVNSFTKVSSLIKPNTKYLVIYEIKQNSLNGIFTLLSQHDKSSVFTLSSYPNINPGQTGIFKYIVTTDATFDSDKTKVCLRNFLNAKSTTGSLVYRSMVFEYIEGMENWDIPFFRGIQSVKMPVLTTTGKNLFNGVLEKGNYNGGTNNLKSSVFTLKELTEYTISNDKNYSANVVFHDDNNQYISEQPISQLPATFETPLGTKYAWIRTWSNQDDLTVKFQIEEGSVATPYEPYKSNILHTPEEVVLKGIGDLKDTLNCNTGEYVERIKEVVYTGDEDWKSSAMATTPDNIAFYIPLENYLDNTNNVTMRNSIKDNLGFTNNCLSATVNVPELNGVKGFSIHTNGNAYFTIPTSECANVESWKTKLREQHLVLQYATTPTIKTVDLSSSGNWEKIVLDGSEDEAWIRSTTNNNYFVECNLPNRLQGMENNGWVNTLPMSQVYTSNTNIGACIVNSGGLRIRTKEILNGQSLEEWKQYLQQNPITVWYQIQTHKDSTQVKQPIFFKDGHIQLSSGADNSLIPTLDYQAKTSNSYVMDLMKTNTRYTMKSSSASGNFTIDGTQYNFNTNGTFTTPSTMNNKLMIANGTVADLMFIEGAVTDKTIPYFKGIKSAFEDEDKIEVLSTGKNLYPYGDSTYTPEHSGWYFINGDRQTLWGEKVHKDCGQGAWFYLDGGRYYFSVVNNNNVQTLQVVGDKEQLYGDGRLIPSGWYTLRMSVKNANEEVNITNIMVEKDTKTTYEPRKSNSTKIPLLSSLRSLPNGVCDEIILDRENNKAKIVQRVGKVVLDGSEDWNLSSYSHDKLVEFVYHGGVQIAHTVFSDRFATGGVDVERVAFSGRSIYIRILKTKVSNVDSFKKWLSQNPLTVQYGLDTPVITEVDLEGYPYIYKDGHIFLNTDIAPTTTIKYSINQAQVIQSQNSDIIRHSKEITNLHRLISEYVQVQYESTLLNLTVKMRA